MKFIANYIWDHTFAIDSTCHSPSIIDEGMGLVEVRLDVIKFCVSYRDLLVAKDARLWPIVLSQAPKLDVTPTVTVEEIVDMPAAKKGQILGIGSGAQIHLEMVMKYIQMSSGLQGGYKKSLSHEIMGLLPDT